MNDVWLFPLVVTVDHLRDTTLIERQNSLKLTELGSTVKSIVRMFLRRFFFLLENSFFKEVQNIYGILSSETTMTSGNSLKRKNSNSHDIDNKDWRKKRKTEY